MHDRRIARGNTYAAMVIPAGTNPEAMVMDKSYPAKRRSFKRPTVVSYRTISHSLQKTEKMRAIYPNRDIPTPEPVPGREHREF